MRREKGKVSAYWLARLWEEDTGLVLNIHIAVKKKKKKRGHQMLAVEPEICPLLLKSQHILECRSR